MADFYQTLVDEGEAGIDRLMTQRAQEGLQLDFKTKENASNGLFSDNDKRVFAKALSAFSNSAGGVIVYGVTAVKGADGVDCAQHPGAPISEIERFRSDAVTLAGQLLQPKHDGIDMAIIHCAAALGSGYLVVKVPRSERRPHRSEAKEQKQYFKRSGDNSFTMEHYDIEDMFRRFSVPELKCEMKTSTGQSSRSGLSAESTINFDVFLSNISNNPARSPYVATDLTSGYDSYRSTQYGISVRAHGTLRFFETEGALIYPGTSKLIAPLSKAFVLSLVEGKYAINQSDLFFSCEIRFGCESVAIKSSSVHVSAEEILNSITPRPVVI